MLMMCWFYCMDLAWFLYYALGPIVFLCGMFALKRGIANQRKHLRETAFQLMGLMVAKVFGLDPIVHADALKRQACHYSGKALAFGCDNMQSTSGQHLLMMIMFATGVIVGYSVYEAWKKYMPDSKPKMMTPEQVHLDFWANITFISVIVMVCWQLAPWVGYLTVGCVPKIFIMLKWQQLALLNTCLLTTGFWKLESCVWQFKVEEKEKMKYMHSSWTPKDTLWMTVFVYLITLAMSYVAHDVMVRTHTVPEACHPGEVKDAKQWNILDIEDMEVYR